jgi:hypothetical protein
MVTEATSPTATKALNLRDIPLPVYTQLKVYAAASNMGIREYCISIFEAHIQQQAQSGGGTITVVGPLISAPVNLLPQEGPTPTTTAQEKA